MRAGPAVRIESRAGAGYSSFNIHSEEGKSVPQQETFLHEREQKRQQEYKPTTMRTQGRGRGRGGGRGRGKGQSKKNGNGNSKEQQQPMFYPHGDSGQRIFPYNTVKERIIHYVQRSYENGYDVSQSLERMQEIDLNSVKPMLDESRETDTAKKAIQQRQYDLEFEAKSKMWLERNDKLRQNMLSAYSLIYSTYCSKAIQSRIESHPDYNSTDDALRIKDNPINLLAAIKVVMHDPLRAKYPYASLTESLLRTLTAKQGEKEDLAAYVRRFKDARDVMKSQLGTDFLEKFVETTQEYCETTDALKQQNLKDGAFAQWMGYVFMHNSDKNRYGTLLSGMASQYAMGQNQYPADITKATDILNSHPSDKEAKSDKKRGEKQQDNESKKSTAASFAELEGKVCWCCGKKGHISQECKNRNKIPYSQWHVNKAVQHMQTTETETENEDEANNDNDDASTSSNRSASRGRRQWSGFQLCHLGKGTSKKCVQDDSRSVWLIDTGSQMSSACNERMVDNIHESKNNMLVTKNQCRD